MVVGEVELPPVELVAMLGGGLMIAAIGARWTLFLAGPIPMTAGLVALAVSRCRLAEPVLTEARA